MYTDTYSPNICFGIEQTLIFKYNVVNSTSKAKIKIQPHFTCRFQDLLILDGLFHLKTMTVKRFVKSNYKNC